MQYWTNYLTIMPFTGPLFLPETDSFQYLNALTVLTKVRTCSTSMSG